MKAYKFFRAGARASLTGHSWPLPLSAADATWLQAADGPLVPCRNGLHACRVEQLAYWISEELWQVELGEERLETPHAIVARRARLLQRIEAWQGPVGREFTAACLERARAQLASASQVSTLARQYLEACEQYAREGKPALTAYVGALVCAALGAADQQMANFDAERREQSLLLAAAAGLSGV